MPENFRTSIEELAKLLRDIPDRVDQFTDFYRFVNNPLFWALGTVFLTVNGRIGVSFKWGSRAPKIRSNPEPGDGIFVLDLGRVPYILRPGPDDDYRLIADCYVHSWMDGEALELPVSQHLEVTIV